MAPKVLLMLRISSTGAVSMGAADVITALPRLFRRYERPLRGGAPPPWPASARDIVRARPDRQDGCQTSGPGPVFRRSIRGREWRRLLLSLPDCRSTADS